MTVPAPRTIAEAVAETVVVPASTMTPPTPSPQPPSSGRIPTIQIAPAAAADDEELVRALVGIVNAVYGETEGDIFVAGYERVGADEVRRLMRAGELAVVYFPAAAAAATPSPTIPATPAASSDSNADGDDSGPLRAIGCMRINRLADANPPTGELGMVAVDPSVRGGGLGRAMAAFAERHCRKTLGLQVLRLELLVPQTCPDHPFKMRLQAWYTRMGYKLVRLGVFQDDYPQLAPLLRGPCEYRVFEKELE